MIQDHQKIMTGADPDLVAQDHQNIFLEHQKDLNILPEADLNVQKETN